MSRMIHKSVSSSQKLASLSKESLIIFTMMIPHFNAHGKLNGSPNFIKGEVVPRLKWATLPIIEKCLSEISEKTNVKWYEDEGLYYIQSLSWGKHQKLRPDRLGKDSLPDYSGTTPGLLPREVKLSKVEVEGEDKGNPAESGSDDEIVEIVEFLNKTTISFYRPNSVSTIKVIKARLKEGYSIEDFKKVIARKAEEWTGTKWEKFLRPKTLFAGDNFEGYLNQKKSKEPVKGSKSTDRSKYDAS